MAKQEKEILEESGAAEDLQEEEWLDELDEEWQEKEPKDKAVFKDVDEEIDASPETDKEKAEKQAAEEIKVKEESTKKASKRETKTVKKKEKTDKKSEAMKEKIEELEDRVKRQMAEFENFRKRTEKEKTAMFETGAKSVIEKILPIVDNFERGFQGMSEEDLKEPFAQGMKMVYDQLVTELDNLGVKPIEAVGCEFDPELHNAVMQVQSDEYEEGIIAQELLRGYTYRDSVVRHSMVAVTQ